MSISEYRKRRRFSRTPEPRGEDRAKRNGPPIFVIQKHDASALRYAFRLEADDVLKSWAVPKGPSTDPRERRLAIRTEDQPLEYADFAGTIPEGAISEGHVGARQAGEKICGGYALQRTGSDDDDIWLLIKMDDDEADARQNPGSTEPLSVASERGLDDFRTTGDK